MIARRLAESSGRPARREPENADFADEPPIDKVNDSVHLNATVQ
jgi:hypothetical protein